MNRYGEIIGRMLTLARENASIRAVIAIGSYARGEADEFSDLDLMIATECPEEWLDGKLPQQLGEMRISFVEPTLAGGMERRVLYEGSLEVDMMVFTPGQLLQAVSSGEAGAVMNRGFTILHDTMQIAPLIAQHVRRDTAYVPMTEAEFVNLVNQLFFHVVWAEKKLRRGECWAAKMCVDSYMKGLLLQVLELARHTQADVWHDGRFLDQWAGNEVVCALKECFAGYESEAVAHALRATSCLFAQIAREAAKAHGYAYPEEAEQYANSQLG